MECVFKREHKFESISMQRNIGRDMSREECGLKGESLFKIHFIHTHHSYKKHCDRNTLHSFILRIIFLGYSPRTRITGPNTRIFITNL